MTVSSWSYFLCAVAAMNVAAWMFSVRALNRRQPLLQADIFAARRLQLLLSAIYVFGCGYRSVFLVYDVPRIGVYDTFLSSAIIGRSVATIAELSFVAQWALLLGESSRATGSVVGRVVSRALVPLIVIAETCSWYSVLTTSNLGHVAEESIWGLCAALLVACVAVILPRSAPTRRPVLALWCFAGLVYVAYMFTVDVPLYWSRWLADEAGSRQYMSIAQGLVDVATRRVVSHRWEDWRHEVVWMTLYFSVAVWISISLIHAPAARALRRLPALAPRPEAEPA
jgi:hypothetical protein